MLSHSCQLITQAVYHVQMEFELPLRLKQVLLGEYESIFRHDQLPGLPHKPCVADILAQYVDQSNSEGLDFEQEVRSATSTGLLYLIVPTIMIMHS